MHVTIDAAGRIVVPKRLRDALGLTPGTRLDVDVLDGHIELSPPTSSAKIVAGPHGPTVAATGAPVTDHDLRDALEAVRERR